MSTPNAPIWLTPSSPGMLCNFYGSNAGSYETPPAPILAAGAGTSNLPAGTYTFELITYGPRGVSSPSPSASITILANKPIGITIPDPTDNTFPLMRLFLTAAPAGVSLGEVPLRNPDGSLVALPLNSGFFQQGGAPGDTNNLTSSTQASGAMPSGNAYDGIPLTLRYSNPNPSSRPAGLRYRAARVGRNGSRAEPEGAYDEGFLGWTSLGTWSGNIATQPLPVHGTLVPKGAVCSPQVGRIYALVTQPTNWFPSGKASAPLMSAPVSGASVGTWRLENAIPKFSAGDSCNPGSLCIVNGNLYALTDQALWFAPILGDGLVGEWQVAVATSGGESMCGFDNGQAGGIICVFYANDSFVSSNDPVNSYTVNSDGTLTAAGSTTMTVHRRNGGCFIDPSSSGTTGYLVYVGGQDATPTDQSTVLYIQVDVTTGVFSGSWTTSANPLPVPLSGFGLAHWGTAVSQFNSPGGIVAKNQGGGTTMVGGSSNGAAQNKIYMAQGNNWFTQPVGQLNQVGTIPSALASCSAAVTDDWPFIDQIPPSAIPEANGGLQNIVVLGPSVTYGQTGNLVNNPYGTFQGGNASEVTTTTLGPGSSVVNNGDGTVDVTFYYGAQDRPEGPSNFIASFTDGDLVQFDVQFIDQAGDPSPWATTLINIGQAPSIQSLVPASSTVEPNANFLIDFLYASGAGNFPTQSEMTWEAQVIDNSNVVQFDTGVRKDQSNNVQTGLSSNLLATPLKVVATVASRDVPMNDGHSVNTASATSTGITTSAAAPTVPTSVAATPDNVNGIVTVSWTNPAGSSAATNRIYFRLTGTSTWTLLKDNVTAVIGSAQSIQLLDQIAFDQQYDFAVSARTSVGAESSMATGPTGIVIAPTYQFDLGGFHAMLHVAGFTNGVANGLATANRLPLFLVGPPVFQRQLDSAATVTFGSKGATTRYGPFSYRQLQLQPSIDVENLAVIDAFLQLVQASGAVLCYRDTSGYVIYCTIDINHQSSHQFYIDHQITLVEAQYVYQP